MVGLDFGNENDNCYCCKAKGYIVLNDETKQETSNIVCVCVYFFFFFFMVILRLQCASVESYFQ